MFAKTTLASAVAAAIGVSAVGIAQADSAFFPYVVLSDTVTTIVSVVNTDFDDDFDDKAADPHTLPDLHYRLYYKNNVEEALDGECVEYNVRRATSRNDLQTIDLGGNFGSTTLGVLFNDPSFYNNWQAPNRTFALGLQFKPLRGYLYVDNTNIENGEETLTGEAIIFEFGSGAAWGYQAYSNDSDGDSEEDRGETDYRYAASQSPTNVNFMPFEEFSTAFFVTPVGEDMAPINNNDLTATIALGMDTALVEGLGYDGYTNVVFDRDENPISGTTPVSVVCVARVDAADLVGGGVESDLADGGWGQLYNYSDEDTREAAAVIIKLEYNTGATFNGEPVGGTFNNAEMLDPEGFRAF